VKGLVLSLFPGIGMLDYAFELEGWCVVRGPDLLWGGDVRRFYPPRERFDGVIGGPPCQSFSPIGNVNRARYGDECVMPDMIPEFSRVVDETAPEWWVMENSPYAYAPLSGALRRIVDNKRLNERQDRKRAFWSNLALEIDYPALMGPDAGSERTVSGKGAVDWKGSRAREKPRSLSDMLELQGFPRDHLESQPFTVQAAKKMVGNGVPLPMGRAVAQAVGKALARIGGGAEPAAKGE